MEKNKLKKIEKYEDWALVDEAKYLRFWKKFGLQGEKIPDGARIKPTKWAIQNGVADENERATKLRNRKYTKYSMWILKDGNKSPASYWSGFWEKEFKLLPN